MKDQQEMRIPDVSLARKLALLAILAERRRQDDLFGDGAGFDDDPPHVRLAVLQKKLSDYAVAVAQEDLYFAHIPGREARQELTELAAVCLALLEVVTT